jgi:hypothetical protein
VHAKDSLFHFRVGGRETRKTKEKPRNKQGQIEEQQRSNQGKALAAKRKN